MINNYCLGLFATDGSLQKYIWKSKNKVSYTITLEMKDSQIIEEIAEIFDENVFYRKRTILGKEREFYKMSVKNNEYGELLDNKKNLIEYFKKLQKNEQNEFIRGCFDGDGGICTKKPKGYRTYFCANSKDGLDKIYEYWLKENNIVYSKYTDKRGSTAYNYNIGKQSEVKKMCELMYKNSNIKLLRKYNIYKKMVS